MGGITAPISKNPSTMGIAFEEYKADSNEEDHPYVRTVSIARPSVRSDLLTEDDTLGGNIQKQSPSFLKQWQKRYFLLEKKMLKYYKSEKAFQEGKPPKGVINFQQIWVEPTFIDL